MLHLRWGLSNCRARLRDVHRQRWQRTPRHRGGRDRPRQICLRGNVRLYKDGRREPRRHKFIESRYMAAALCAEWPCAAVIVANWDAMTVGGSYTVASVVLGPALAGSCTCKAGYTGAACDSCDEGFTGYPSCVDDACDPDPCNGHSDSCDSSDGSCTCSAGYTGAACDSCDEGFIGYPSCVEDPRYKQRFCDGMYLYRNSDLAETPSPVRPRPTPSRHRRLRTSLPPRA